MNKRKSVKFLTLMFYIVASVTLSHGKNYPKDTTVVFFPVSSTDIYPYIEDHQDDMESFIGAVREAYSAGDLECVEITGSSCLIGSSDKCTRVARRRAMALSGYIARFSGIPRDIIVIKDAGISWKTLAGLVKEDTGVPAREKVIETIEETPLWIFDNDGRVVDGRKKRIMEISGGRSFAYMREHFFPEMRFASARLILSDRKKAAESTVAVTEAVPSEVARAEETAAEQKMEIPVTAAATDSVPVTAVPKEQPADTAGQGPAISGEVPAFPAENEDTWAGSKIWLKTNIPYWGAVIPNLAVEIRLADRWSLDIPVFYSPFTVSRSYMFRIASVQPGIRYWLKPEMKGHFFGVHAIGGAFNIAVSDELRYQDTDGAWGAGIDYGYALRFSPHWGMEFNIGVGYLWARYETFYNIHNGASCGISTLNYFGITRIGISLIYKL